MLACSLALSKRRWLYKLNRNGGLWQRRWFETKGCTLVYYKSYKKAKVLAAISLPKIGHIQLVDSPSNVSCFQQPTCQADGTVYTTTDEGKV